MHECGRKMIQVVWERRQTPANNRRWQIAQQINQIHLTDTGGVGEKFGCSTGHVNESKMKTKGSGLPLKWLVE